MYIMNGATLEMIGLIFGFSFAFVCAVVGCVVYVIKTKYFEPKENYKIPAAAKKPIRPGKAKN
jgi:hypothetical protein